MYQGEYGDNCQEDDKTKRLKLPRDWSMLLHQGTHEPSRLASRKSKHVSEEASTDFSQAPFCSFPVFECLLSQRCWSRRSRRYVLWHRFLLARSTSDPKQFCYLKWLYQLKIIARPQKHVLGWHILLPLIPCLWNSSMAWLLRPKQTWVLSPWFSYIQLGRVLNGELQDFLDLKEPVFSSPFLKTKFYLREASP